MKSFSSSSGSSSPLPAVPPSTRMPSDLLRTRDFEKAREYLKDLSVHYERYLDAVLARLYRFNHLRSEIDEIIGNVKDHLFWPSDERLRSESFWLWRYNPHGGGRLRAYLAACAKNYARDKLRNKHPLRIDPLAIENFAAVAAPSPGGSVDHARQTKLILIEHAKQKCREEYGDDAVEWRAFTMRTLAGSRLPAPEVAASLDISEYQVANYVYQVRQRIMEILWLCLFDLEKTDILSDTIMVLDMAILSTIMDAEMDDDQTPSEFDPDAAFRESARESAAALAADHDMQEMFGVLPKCRKDKKFPLR